MKPLPNSERHSLSIPRLASSRHGRALFRVPGARCGSALITALVFALIVAITLAGIGTLTVSHYSLAHSQADSAAALNLAEAGINYELNQITKNAGQSDPPGTIVSASSAIDPSLGGGFSITCTYPDGTPWAGPTLTQKTVVILSTAHVNGATRKVTIHGAPMGAFYTTYSVGGAGAYTQFLGEGAIVDGRSGTNGGFYIAPNLISKPKITSIVFNGPDAKWVTAPNSKAPSGYNSVSNGSAVTWETVTTKLNEKFPGGASYVAQHNDNGLATISDPSKPSNPVKQGIVGNNLNPQGYETVTLHSRLDGQDANYYFTNIYMSQHSNIIFDNAHGKINVYYVAPLGASGGSQYLRGGHTVKSLVDAPKNGVQMYISATSTLGITPNDANDEVDMGIYAYDAITMPGNPKPIDFGRVALMGNVNFKGQIIAKSISVEGSAHITGQEGYFEQPQEYFGFSGAWRELDSTNAIGGANQ